MMWTRITRRPDRLGRRPGVENLETRLVLSDVGLTASVPASTPGTSSAAAPAAFDTLIGASTVRATYGVTGQGLTAAVIDMGVDYTHEALGGGFGAGYKVVAGRDIADNTADPAPAGGAQHGTAVASLIASTDPQHPGVAPGADIAALRVFNNSNQGDYKYIIQALQWVVDNHTQYDITVVNVSISDNRNYSFDWFSHDGGTGQKIATLIDQLKALNIPVVAAAGNSYAGQQGMGFIAIVPDTVSVTGTDLNDQFVSDAQRLGTSVGGTLATDLAAPSKDVTAATGGNGFGDMSGTSYAAPQVSGAIILLQSIYEQRFHAMPTVDQVLGWLKAGSDPVTDPTTNVTIGRIDLPKAAALIPQADPPPAAMTRLFVNGQPAGVVPSNSTANPLNGSFADFGIDGTFQTVSTWNANSNPLNGAFSAFGLDGTFQTISIWSATGTGAASLTSHPAGSAEPASSQPTTVASRAQTVRLSIQTTRSQVAQTTASARPGGPLALAASRKARVASSMLSAGRFHR